MFKTVRTTSADNGLALVTGASGAVGSAIAHELAKQGRDLLLHDYDSVEATRVFINSAKPSISVTGVTGDILDPTFAGRLFDLLGGRRIQVLVHADGVVPSARNAHDIFGTNFSAAKKLVETLQPRMEEGGVIILVASLGDTFVKNMLVDIGVKRRMKGSWSPTVWLLSKSHYTSCAISERCVQLYVKHKAVELAPLGVRIVSVSPGLVEVDTTDGPRRRRHSHASLLGNTPMNKLGRADEIAPIVGFLTSPGASYISGTDLTYDGRLASQRWKAAKHTETVIMDDKFQNMQQQWNAECTRIAHAGANRRISSIRQVKPGVS